jgi:hypothetical protein
MSIPQSGSFELSRYEIILLPINDHCVFLCLQRKCLVTACRCQNIWNYRHLTLSIHFGSKTKHIQTKLKP